MMKPTETEIRQMKDFAQIFGKDSILSERPNGCRMISTLAGAEGNVLIARYNIENGTLESLVKKSRTGRDPGAR